MLLEFLQKLFGHHPVGAQAPRQCLMCGACCKAFGGHLHASALDLERWRSLGRDDILRWVGNNGWLWVDPASRHIVHHCPFLRPFDANRFICGIHEIKPDICRSYPTLAHARRCLKGVFLQTTLVAGAICGLLCLDRFCP